MPTSSSTFFIRQLIIQSIYVLLQFAVYRILRSQFWDTPLWRTIVLAAMVSINLPWLFTSAYLIIFRRPPQSYTLLVTIFGWFMLALIYVLYFAIMRAGYALWEVIQPASLSATTAASAALTRRAFLQKATIGFGAVALLSSTRGIWMARGKPRLEHITLHLPNLPAAFDGLRIVQLSDFHSGPYMSREQMLAIRQMAEELKPDLYFLTGDFVDTLPEQMPPFVDAFEKLQAPLGVFAVLGNHDYFAKIETVEAGLSAARLPWLRNQHHILEYRGEKLAIIGVDDLWASRFAHRGPNIANALQGLPEDIFKICLSHQPNYWHEIKKHRLDVTFCGHTHGGQIGIVGTQISLARLAGPYVAGLYKENGMQLYVNRG